MCAKAYSNKNGKKDIVGEQLTKLLSQFKVLKNVFLRLDFYVTHPRSSEKVKSCQIDYMVIGSSGVFLITSKEWDEYAFTEMIPNKEAEKADLVVYIKLNNHFTYKIPKFTVIIPRREAPIVQHRYIHQFTVWTLCNFIFEKEDKLSKSEIRKITQIMLRKP